MADAAESDTHVVLLLSHEEEEEELYSWLGRQAVRKYIPGKVFDVYKALRDMREG